jgi:hypothetical protein
MSARYSLADIAATLFDRTPHQGTLAVQDDLVLDGTGPFDALVTAANAAGILVHDYRQIPRTGRGRAHGTRPIEQVTAILDHQTACELNRPERFLGVPAHAGITGWGNIVLLHPVRAYMYHANGANKFTYGIEHSARAAGIEGDARSFWRSRREKAAGRTYADLVHEIDDRQAIASLLLRAYVVDEVARQGGRIVASMFHRNSHSSRTSDPGSRIALTVSRPFAVERGLEYGSPVVGSGSRTPGAWGGDAGVRY